MRGTEHYDEAQRHLTLADEAHEVDDLDLADYLLARAQVHAELATAGALAALIGMSTRGTPIVVTTDGASR